MTIFLRTVFLFLFIPQAFALTPIELIALVQDRAPLIKVFAEQQSANEQGIKKARTYGNPVLTFQGGELRTGGQRGGIVDFTLMQPLPWPGKRSTAIAEQEFLTKISRLSLEEAKLELGHRVYLLAYELALATAVESHNKERRDRFNLISRYLTSRPLVSPKQALEKDLIMSQLRVVEKTMNQATARKRGLEKELQILSGLETTSVSVDWGKLPLPHERTHYLSGYTQSHSFRRMQEEKKISENKIEAARLEARPDIMVGVNYRQENVAPVNHFYHGQVSVVIPIVDRGQHSEQKARAELRRTEAELSLLDQETRTELEYLMQELELAKRNLEIFPLSLREQSEVRFRKAEEAFRKGQIDVMTFLQSDTQVHENVHLVYDSRLEYLNTLSRLERKVGHQMEIE